MKIKIANPVGFSRIGGRTNNEDAIYPLENDATLQTELFVVCDGMGGHSNGEIASRLTSVGFANYLNAHPELSNPNSKADIYRPWDIALNEVESSFENYIFKNPESKGMGTTLCFLHIHSLGITIGHIGDSRIYQIRGNKVIFKTDDHSRVNELLKLGHITEEEAVNYPGKNIITRAIQGANSPTKIEFDILSDIEEGDYFFICTDGVLEQINDRILEEIFSAYGYTLEEKANLIIEKCQNLTKDNYSGYLIEIAGITGEIPIHENEEREYIIEERIEVDYENSDVTQLIAAPKPRTSAVPQSQSIAPKKASKTYPFLTKSKDILLGLGYAFGGLVIAFFAYLIYDGLTADRREKKKPEVRQETEPVKLVIPTDDSPKKAEKSKSKRKVTDKPLKKKESKQKPVIIPKKSEDKPEEQVPVKPAEPEKTKVERPIIQND